MYNRLTYYFKNLFNLRSKERIAVYIICLALSSFLWLLNSLEKNYTHHISVPVKYINLPADKKIASPLPKRLEMTVDATGYTILQHELSFFFSPLLLDVNELTNSSLNNKYISKYAISTMNHKESIGREISNDLSIISIWPDTIFFDMSRLVNRKVKVQPQVKLSFLKDFSLKKAPFTNPDSVWVNGPENIFDTLKVLRTMQYEYNDLSSDHIREVKLNIPPGVTSKMKKVILNIPVEQFTEATFEIPVNIDNAPDSILIKTFPGKVRVSCLVGLSEYANINKNSFRAFINYDEKHLSLNKLPVQLGRYPESVISADYTPKEVEYVIELKK